MTEITLPPSYLHPIRIKIVNLALSYTGSSGPSPWAEQMGIQHCDPKTSWCGLFRSAILREAGLIIPNWRIGEGNVQYLRLLRDDEEPLPGDVLCYKKWGHQCILEAVRADSHYQTIDGNAGGYPGKVCRAVHARDGLSGIYSIDPLLIG